MKAKKQQPRKTDATVAVRVSRDELELMRAAAERDGRTMSNWIRMMLAKALSGSK